MGGLSGWMKGRVEWGDVGEKGGEWRSVGEWRECGWGGGRGEVSGEVGERGGK